MGNRVYKILVTQNITFFHNDLGVKLPTEENKKTFLKTFESCNLFWGSFCHSGNIDLFYITCINTLPQKPLPCLCQCATTMR
jgi:hypothetical protein